MPAEIVSSSRVFDSLASGRETPPRVSLGHSDDSAERLLSILTLSAYRKGSLHQMNFTGCRETLLAAVRACVAIRKPIQITLMAFPFKVPNPFKVGARSLPDLAELAAIRRFCHLNSRLKAVYEPGVQFHIIHDGPYIADLFGVPAQEVQQYERYFANLVRAARANDVIQMHDFCTLLGRYGGGEERDRESLRTETMTWWRSQLHTPEWVNLFAKTFGMMNLREFPMSVIYQLMARARCGELPAEYRMLEERVHTAMLTYYFRDSVLHDCDPRPAAFPDAIHATTKQRVGRLALWLVERGRSLLPWHGVGVITADNEWRVELAQRVAGDPLYRPCFIDREDTPFFYLQTRAA